MPLFNFYCEKCKEFQKKLFANRPDKATCVKCNLEMSAATSESKVTTRVVEIIDKGFPKAVERLANIKEIKREVRLQDEREEDII